MTLELTETRIFTPCSTWPLLKSLSSKLSKPTMSLLSNSIQTPSRNNKMNEKGHLTSMISSRRKRGIKDFKIFRWLTTSWATSKREMSMIHTEGDPTTKINMRIQMKVKRTLLKMIDKTEPDSGKLIQAMSGFGLLQTSFWCGLYLE